MNTDRLMCLLALLASMLLVSCGGTVLRDDDDSSSDDDDIANDDDVADDDDDVSDDDDVLADDDDSSSSDDDDSEPPAEEGDSEVEGIWLLSYWTEAPSSSSEGIPLCQQAYQFTAAVEFSPFAVGGSCTICTGEVVLLNLVEVSSSDPGVTIPCDPMVHFPTSDDLGSLLTDPSSGFGDFLNDQALMDRETAFIEGVTTSQQAGSPSLQDLHNNLQSQGARLTHVGYVEAPPKSSYFGMIGLHTVAVPPPGAPDYLPMWWYATAAGSDLVMSGEYVMGSFWQINSNNVEADYQTVTFSGSLQATFTPSSSE
jgi:hypothetical protein